MHETLPRSMRSALFQDQGDKQGAALFRDDNRPGHAVMSASAKNVTMKGERARRLRDKAQCGGFARRDLGADPQAGTAESMQSVQRGEFQDDRYAFPDRYRAGVVFKPFAVTWMTCSVSPAKGHLSVRIAPRIETRIVTMATAGSRCFMFFTASLLLRRIPSG